MSKEDKRCPHYWDKPEHRCILDCHAVQIGHVYAMPEAYLAEKFYPLLPKASLKKEKAR